MPAKISKKSLDRLFFYLVVFDLLFFPYIRFLSASLSMVLLPVWFVMRGSIIRNENELKLVMFAILLALISLFLGFKIYHQGFLLRDGSMGGAINMLPNTAIICYALLYYIFFKNILYRYRINIEILLIVYLIFVFILSMIYYFEPSYYFEVRSFWTMSDKVIEIGDFFNSMYRFTSTLSDPNNLAALIISILSFIVIYNRSNYVVAISLSIMVSAIIVTTMSSSGVVLFVVSVVAFLFNDILNSRKNYISLALKIASSVLFVLVIVYLFSYFQETEFGKLSISRTIHNSIYPRLEIWSESFDLIKIVGSIFFGDGGLVIIDGRVINPHNGHLHLIYSYGFIFYLIFMIVFFLPLLSNPKLERFFFSPLFVCFTINVGLYELRFAGILSLLVAAFKVSEIKCNNDKNRYRTVVNM